MNRTTRLRTVSVLATCLLVLALAPRAFGQVDAAFDDSSELSLHNFRTAAVRPVGSDRSEVDIVADLENVGIAVWGSAVATLGPGSDGLEIVEGKMVFATVPRTGSVTSSTVWTVEVSSGRVGLLASELAARAIRYRVLGDEIPVYAGSPYILDEETDESFDRFISFSDGWVLIFSASTPLLEAIDSGDLLVEDPLPTGYRCEQSHTLYPSKIVAKRIYPSGRVQLNCVGLDPTDYPSGISISGRWVGLPPSLRVIEYRLGLEASVNHFPVGPREP